MELTAARAVAAPQFTRGGGEYDGLRRCSSVAASRHSPLAAAGGRRSHRVASRRDATVSALG